MSEYMAPGRVWCASRTAGWEQDQCDCYRTFIERDGDLPCQRWSVESGWASSLAQRGRQDDLFHSLSPRQIWPLRPGRLFSGYRRIHVQAALSPR